MRTLTVLMLLMSVGTFSAQTVQAPDRPSYEASYKIEEKQLLATIDNGSTWRVMQTPYEAQLVAWDKSSPNHVIAAAHEGVCLSIDGGYSWQARLRLPPDYKADRLEFVAGAAQTIELSGSRTGLSGRAEKESWRSADGGVSWQCSRRGGQTNTISNSMARRSQASQGDTSGGVIWGPVVQLSPTATDNPLDGNYSPHFAVQGDTIHCTWETGQLRLPYIRSTNGGLTWEEPRDLLTDTTISMCTTSWEHIVANGQDVYIFFVFTFCHSGIEVLPVYFVKSADRGTTWSAPISATSESTGVIFSTSIRENILAAVYGPDVDGRAQYPRVTSSINGGVDWSRSAQSSPSSTSDQERLALTPGLLNLFHPGDRWPGPAPEIVLHRSTDLAKTWKDSVVLSPIDGNGSDMPEAAAFIEHSCFSAGTTLGVMWRGEEWGGDPWSAGMAMRLSYDNGTSWQPLQVISDLPFATFHSFVIKNSIVAATWSYDVGAWGPFHVKARISLDGGNNWDSVTDLTPQADNAGNSDMAITDSAVHVAWSQDTGIVLPDVHHWNIFYCQGKLLHPPSPFSVSDGWNLLSLPTKLPSYETKDVYPTAVSSTFTYQGRYIDQDTLKYGVGYWVKFASPQTVAYTGETIDRDTMNVVPRWNLIGGPGASVDTSMIRSDPPGIIRSKYFGFDCCAYAPASVLKPGRGYWVKVSEKGRLFVPSSPGKTIWKVTGRNSELDDFNTLSFEDGSGRRQTLYFASRIADKDLASRYELPPLPPPGTFDVRFASQSMVEVLAGDTLKEISIQLTGATYPLTVTWNVTTEESRQWRIEAGAMRQVIAAEGKLLLDEPTGGSLSLIALPLGQRDAPLSYSLEQNYPNPFNPATVIDYRIPVAGYVTVKVYDVLGREVAVLVDQEKEPGAYRVKWMAESQPSGVYYYRLTSYSGQTGVQSRIRKMILMK